MSQDVSSIVVGCVISLSMLTNSPFGGGESEAHQTPVNLGPIILYVTSKWNFQLLKTHRNPIRICIRIWLKSSSYYIHTSHHRPPTLRSFSTAKISIQYSNTVVTRVLSIYLCEIESNVAV